MEYREVEANNLDEAKSIIKKQYGDNARIIKITEGSMGGFLGFGRKKHVRVLISIPEIELLKKFKENMGIDKQRISKENALKNSIIELSKNKETVPLTLIMEKLNKIERQINHKGSDNGEGYDDLHANLIEIKQILKDNEFYDDFIKDAIKSIQENLSYSMINDRVEVHKYIYEYIKGKLGISTNIGKKGEEKKIFILVGPTGVGKTTTIAKITANAIKEGLRVELITIDGYRIGAKYQLEKYAEYMRTPMTGVEENMELQKLIDLSDADLILIDTIGRSSRDEMNLLKMKQLLKLNNYYPEYILTLCASIKMNEVKHIFKSFDIFDYNSVIITKTDESETIGAILNCSIDRKCGIKYITTGQRVPNDIEKASQINLMNKIRGLKAEVYVSSSVM